MLSGKKILILGSSRGIGKETARLAKLYGAEVIVHGKSDSKELEEISNELNAKKVIFDTTNSAEAEKEISELLENNVIDGLVNCVGVVNGKPFLETTPEDWKIGFEINILSAVYSCQNIIPHMLKNKRGSIVNVASVRGYPSGSHPSRMVYSAAKAGLINLSYTLAKEYAPYIRVNSVSPGATNTDIAKSWTPELRAVNSNTLMKRIAEPKEIAEMICFLLSDKSSFTTGQDFIVDGGYVLGKI